MRGENNPMYGKSVQEFMTDEEIDKMRQNMSRSKLGRAQTEEHVQKRVESAKNSGKLYGRTPWNKGVTGVVKQSEETKKKKSKSVTFRGVEYYSASEAARIHGTTYYYIIKEIKGIVTSSNRKCTTRKRNK